jgi:hypothetical protein
LNYVYIFKRTHASSSINFRLMLLATYIFEFEEMHFLYTCWHIVGPCRMQGWITHCHHLGYGGPNFDSIYVCHVGSYMILLIVHPELWPDCVSIGKVVVQGY